MSASTMKEVINKYTIFNNNKYEGVEVEKINNWKGKAKDSHIDPLMRYLKNRDMTNTQASERIFSETELDESNSDIVIYIDKLKEILLESPGANFSSSLFERRRKNERHTKVKSYHIYLLKKYLEYDKLTTPTRARYQLHKETGLEVSIKCIKGYILALRDEMDQECDEAYRSSTKSPIRNNNCGRNKLKLRHIELLKKYLKDDNFITSSEASAKIHKETGIKLNVEYTRKLLSVLRKVIDSEYAYSASSCNELPNMLYCRYDTKLKSYHIDILKRYLKENIFITAKQVWNRLRQDTGLEIGLSNIGTHLVILRKEVVGRYFSCDHNFRNVKLLNNSQNRENITNTSINCLPISNNNRVKTSSLARMKIGQNNLKVLMETNNSECSKSESGCKYNYDSACSNYRYKLKDIHIWFLKQYLIEDSLILPEKARDKLYTDTGLDVRVQSIKHHLSRLKNEMELNSNFDDDSTTDSDIILLN
jgi:hypothetical protein